MTKLEYFGAVMVIIPQHIYIFFNQSWKGVSQTLESNKDLKTVPWMKKTSNESFIDTHTQTHAHHFSHWTGTQLDITYPYVYFERAHRKPAVIGGSPPSQVLFSLCRVAHAA